MAKDNTKLRTNLTAAIDELRTLPEYSAIDRIVQGYCDEWSEFDNDLETKLMLQKRLYILVMRLLPKLTHKQIFMGLVEDYKKILFEHEELLNDVAKRKELETQDIAVFDKWFAKSSYESKIPMLKEYRKHMKVLNVTDNGDVEEVGG